MSIGRGEQPRWGPVHRGAQQEQQRPQMGIARENPRARIAREAAERDRANNREEGDAKKPEQRQDVQEREMTDPWEERRQELAARNDIFDAKGNVTKEGQKILVDSGWNMQQILQIESMQQNHVAPVEVIRPQMQERTTEGRMSSMERGRMAADARARAEQELNERVKRESEARNRILGRQQAGVRAYMDAVRNNMTDASAEEAKRRAEEAYDRENARSSERAAA